MLNLAVLGGTVIGIADPSKTKSGVLVVNAKIETAYRDRKVIHHLSFYGSDASFVNNIEVGDKIVAIGDLEPVTWRDATGNERMKMSVTVKYATKMTDDGTG